MRGSGDKSSNPAAKQRETSAQSGAADATARSASAQDLEGHESGGPANKLVSADSGQPALHESVQEPIDGKLPQQKQLQQELRQQQPVAAGAQQSSGFQQQADGKAGPVKQLVNWLLAGIRAASAVITVSPTYAREVRRVRMAALFIARRTSCPAVAPLCRAGHCGCKFC